MVLDFVHEEDLYDGSGFGKNVIIFSTGMRSSAHADMRKDDTLIVGVKVKFKNYRILE